MKSSIALALIALVSIGPRAFAHAGHGGEPFAQIFAEFADSQFKVRPLSPSAPSSYVIFDDGRKVDLKSPLRAAMKRMAGALSEVPESEELYRDPGWGEWTKHFTTTYLGKFSGMFDRRFWLGFSGSLTRIAYRHGWVPATVIGGGEAFEHFLFAPFLAYSTPKLAAISPTLAVAGAITAVVPWCEVVWGVSLYFTREIREALFLADPRHLRPMTFGQKFSLWRKMRSQRRAVRRAMKNVYGPDGRNLSERSRARSFRDLAAGAESMYGGMFGRSLFRDVLADAECEDCAIGLKRMRYVTVPTIEDLSRYPDEAERVLRTEEYLAFIEQIFKWAELASGDLLRSSEGTGLDRKRVDFETTASKMAGYHELQKYAARMLKAFDDYAVGLRVRAFDPNKRDARSLAMDQDFAKSVAAFVKSYKVRLKEIDEGLDDPLPVESPLRAAPARTRAKVRAWLRDAKFCESLLVATVEPN